MDVFTGCIPYDDAYMYSTLPVKALIYLRGRESGQATYNGRKQSVNCLEYSL